MENIPEREVTSCANSVDEESNARFAQKMGELIESSSMVPYCGGDTESWIRFLYGETDEQETEDDA